PDHVRVGEQAGAARRVEAGDDQHRGLLRGSADDAARVRSVDVLPAGRDWCRPAHEGAQCSIKGSRRGQHAAAHQPVRGPTSYGKMATSMGRLCKFVLVAMVLVAATGSAWAQAQPQSSSSGDDLARARTHFEAGRALHKPGNYTEALREFAAGYQLAPRPAFLLNLGQCYRMLDDLGKAREMYQRYLREAPAGDPERAQAQQVLVEIDKQIAERPSSLPALKELPAPTRTTKPEPPRPATPPASVAPAPATNALT